MLLQLGSNDGQPQRPLSMILAVQMILLIEASLGNCDCHIYDQVELCKALLG